MKTVIIIESKGFAYKIVSFAIKKLVMSDYTVFEILQVWNFVAAVQNKAKFLLFELFKLIDTENVG